MKTTIIIIILFFQLSIFGQSSFKKYKDTKTGAITAYADGIKLIKVEKTSWSNNSKTIGELKPKFNNGKYYLKFTSDEIQQSLGELSEVWEFCFFNSKSAFKKITFITIKDKCCTSKFFFNKHFCCALRIFAEKRIANSKAIW